MALFEGDGEPAEQSKSNDVEEGAEDQRRNSEGGQADESLDASAADDPVEDLDGVEG
jgi:hypothetical protein